MKRNPSGNRLFCLLIAAAVLRFAFTSPLQAEPRSPLPPWPEANPIGQLKWDAVLSPMLDDSTAALGSEGATLVESWSGYALQREGVLVAPFVMPGVNAQGKANLGHRQGCVRFWFAPGSAGTPAGESFAPVAPAAGMGAGAPRLMEWIVTDDNEVGTLWALSLNESGTVISLASGGAEMLRAEIKWDAGTWHQVALSYSEHGTELMIDGELVATGAGLLAVEPRISGLVIGSDWQGLSVAGGLFDDVLCFAEPMSAEDVRFNYLGYAHTAAMGPLTKAELAMFSMREQDTPGGTVAYRWSTNNLCPTNGPLHLTNVLCVIESNELVTVEFDVAGPDWTNGLPYDVFATTNLAGATATNGAWVWVTNTFSCSTVVLSNQSWLPTLYILGTPQDSDGDALTDAFETLVSATNPNNSDTDNDGMPDGWEWNHGLNPHDAVDAADDPDGDWLTNFQEYNGGTNSSNPHDVMVLAWGLDHGGQVLVPLNLRDVFAVDGGYGSSVALAANGSVTGWGSAVSSLPNWTNVTQLSATWDQVAVVKADGTVSLLKTNYGLPPADLTNAVQVAAGDRFCLALRANGTVTAWGTNNAGQSSVPTNLPATKAVAAGWEHSVALLQDGTVRAWGQNYGGFGWNLTNVPAGLSNVMSVAAGGFHTLALRADRTVVAWGAGATTNGNSSYFAAEWGQIVVPSGLTNVVAISAGGYHSMALKSDGTVVVWGDLGSFPYAAAQGQIVGIGSGETHGLAMRSGRLLPIILPQPVPQYALPGEMVEFSATGFGLAGVLYQWQFGGVNITGATNETLAISSASTNHEGSYRVVVSTGAGSVFSSNAVFQLVTPPVIASQSMPTNPVLIYQTNVTLSVAATAPGQFTSFPLNYKWQLNGTNITGAASSNYTFMVNGAGTYSVLVSNAVGGTSAVWQVAVTYEGSYMASGTLAHHLSTNAVGYAAGYTGSFTDEQVVSGWTYAFYTSNNMHLLTNAVWSTNCWLKGVRGLSATAIGHTNSEGGRALKTMVSPRHYLYATHTPAGQPVAFLDTNNVIHWRHALQQVDLANDTSVGILDEDLPASVGFLPVIPKDFTNYLPTTSFSFVQGIGMNQDLRSFSQPMLLGNPVSVNWHSGIDGAAPLGLGPNWDVEIRGGDSSAPGRFLVHNQLVLATHNQGPGGGPNYAYQFDAINQLMHYLSTNNVVGTDYQLTPFSLTNWPAIH